jgi:catechol 2,3-dioxygenase-like lactoylglutathione lyase family enzyme
MSASAGRSKERRVATVALVVADYDEAIAWYTEKLGFRLIEDAALGGGKRWVVVAPGSGGGARLLLAEASNDEQRSRIGNQAGGRVFLFLETDDFSRDRAAMLAAGVEFREKPRDEAYGTVAVFSDLYGNLWDLIEPRG